MFLRCRRPVTTHGVNEIRANMINETRNLLRRSKNCTAKAVKRMGVHAFTVRCARWEYSVAASAWQESCAKKRSRESSTSVSGEQQILTTSIPSLQTFLIVASIRERLVARTWFGRAISLISGHWKDGC